MATACKATTKKGEPCRGWAGEDGYCFAHSPRRSKARALARKKGGYNRRAAPRGDPDQVPVKIRTMEDVLTLLDFTTAETLTQENSIARTRALVALAGAYTAAILKGELEARVSALEERYGKVD